MTKADHIRFMSDEKLAAKLAHIMLEMQNHDLNGKLWMQGYIALQKVVLEHLQEPVEEDTLWS